MKNQSNEAKVVRSTYKLTDPEFKYIPQAQTDVQATWKKFGWVPPERKDYARNADENRD